MGSVFLETGSPTTPAIRYTTPHDLYTPSPSSGVSKVDPTTSQSSPPVDRDANRSIDSELLKERKHLAGSEYKAPSSSFRHGDEASRRRSSVGSKGSKSPREKFLKTSDQKFVRGSKTSKPSVGRSSGLDIVRARGTADKAGDKAAADKAAADKAAAQRVSIIIFYHRY